MGESKRSVKNKARVERSICATYLHRETTYFVHVISRTSSCRLIKLGMKHTGKMKHVTQHYQCFDKFVVMQARS